ncbi:MAG: HlyD family secretion protein [Candidatus Cyclobacteriaceae bacterium M3_2C_046]
MKTKHQFSSMILLLPLFLWLLSCSNQEEMADAYGNFESTEITVSAQNAGQIKFLRVEEGLNYIQGQLVGLIDTTQLHLKKKQIMAQKEVIRSRQPSISAQMEVMEVQKVHAEKELERFQKLARQGAATEKQVDDLQDQVNVLEKQIQQIATQNRPLISELSSVQVQIDQIEEQLQDACIYTPISGQVLLKMMEETEMVAPGTPIFKMAKLDTMTLRAYITGSQLDDIQIGQQVSVLIDQNQTAYHELTGKISWIASEAEFTPTGIKTREERADQVYAIKVKVPNPEGQLKIGMPGMVLIKNMTEND